MTWTPPEFISAWALLISALGFGVSIFSLWQTFAAETPIAWLDVQTTETTDCWIANVHLRNRSSVTLRAVSVSVPIGAVPIGKKQDFLLGDYEAAMVDDGGNRSLSLERAGRDINLSLRNRTVRPEEVGTFPVLLFRGALSDAASVQMRFCIQSMAARRRFKTITVTSHIPDGGLTMEIATPV
jgi:hypothetical protein